MSIDSLIGLIASDSECKVLPPKRQISSDIAAPVDLVRFYELTGGVELFPTKPFGFRIVAPEDLLPANPVLKGEFYLKHQAEFDEDDSANWFLIARGLRTEECITIDLNPSRLGWCYDSFWDIYATPDSKVVARTFSELIQHLYKARGASLYWKDLPMNLGKAYDWKRA